MKQSVFLLLALLALSSASLKDIVKKSSQLRKISLLNPELEDVVPEPAGNVVSGPLNPAELEQQQDLPSSYMFGDNVNLEWLTWSGSLPNGAVAIYNGYTERTDYVCKYKCEAGFYNPSLGPYCRYPYGNREYYAPEFEILANKDNFEFLEWMDGSYGSVAQHSVGTCPGVGIYVGKNKYGLGKVVPEFKAFFLPWEGDEYWYKSYQVLAINRDAYSQQITDVKYAIDDVAIFQYPPETMRISGVTNNDCQTVVKTVTISKTTEVETTWNIGRSTMLGVTGSITAKIPFIGSGGIEIGAEKTLQFSRGTTVVESLSHSVSVGSASRQTTPAESVWRDASSKPTSPTQPASAAPTAMERPSGRPSRGHMTESRSEKSEPWWTAVNR
ncbi:hypothetical protein EPR50_G00055320 [Perca flavescens]|uniref:Natterin-3-like n=1 Tax=Perca flavescens TaxID=8167 RepID=A0A484DD98_PERFV|nr:hypothetical protein EPR50_G00055320 [Perca flavescens]